MKNLIVCFTLICANSLFAQNTKKITYTFPSLVFSIKYFDGNSGEFVLKTKVSEEEEFQLNPDGISNYYENNERILLFGYEKIYFEKGKQRTERCFVGMPKDHTLELSNFAASGSDQINLVSNFETKKEFDLETSCKIYNKNNKEIHDNVPIVVSFY